MGKENYKPKAIQNMKQWALLKMESKKKEPFVGKKKINPINRSTAPMKESSISKATSTAKALSSTDLESMLEPSKTD